MKKTEMVMNNKNINLKKIDWRKLNPIQLFVVKDEEKLKERQKERELKSQERLKQKAEKAKERQKNKEKKEKERKAKRKQAAIDRVEKEDQRNYSVEKAKLRLGEETKEAKIILDEKVKSVKRYMDNAYIRGRASWNDLYGSAVERTVNYRRLSLILGVIIAILSIGLIHLAGESKIRTYIAKVDGNGAVLNVSNAAQQPTLTDKIIAESLGQFIKNLRRVTADNIVEKNWMNSVYASIAMSGHGNALKMVKNYISDNNPFSLNSGMTVQVEILSTLKESNKTYQITWKETKRSLSGSILNTANYVAQISYKIGSVKPSLVQYNPFGIYITNISWSRDL